LSEHLKNNIIIIGSKRSFFNAARNLLRMGLELSKISEATGLSLDEIKGLMVED